MPFDITNAFSQFMHLVQDILPKYLDDFVVVFINDILIFSQTTEEHAKHLRLNLLALERAHIYANSSKCLIHITKLNILGQWIMTKCVTLAQSKLEVIRKWENPTRIKVIQSFLGFINYYQRCI